MCGLAGILTLSSVTPERVSAGMSSVLRHRGPDDEGFLAVGAGAYDTFRGDDTVAALGDRPHGSRREGAVPMGLCHRRLSILDLSAAGHQPMVSARRRPGARVQRGDLQLHRDRRRARVARLAAQAVRRYRRRSGGLRPVGAGVRRAVPRHVGVCDPRSSDRVG